MTTCRCGHDDGWHRKPATLYLLPMRYCNGIDSCAKCPCPEFRKLETPDTLTLNGIEEA